jgi:hypothetical protein
MSDTSVSSNYSVKAETAQLLGVPLRDGDAVDDEHETSFVRMVYGVLAENWEAWSNILRLIKARSITKQVRFVKNELGWMLPKGPDMKTLLRRKNLS